MLNNKKLPKRVAAAVLAGILSGSLLTGCGIFNKESEKDTKTTSTASTAAVSGEASNEKASIGGNIVAKTENYSITLPVANFLFNNYYDNNRDYASYSGVDVTKSLKEQYYDEANNITWYDMFMDEVKKYIQRALVLSEAAKADGLSLDDTDNESVNKSLDSIKTSADSAGLTLEEYYKTKIGEGVTQDDLKSYLEITALVSKYYNKLYKSYTYTDEEYEKAYDENKTSYQYADYLRYNFSFSTETDASGDDTAEKQKAKAFAEDLAKCKTEKEFKEYVRAYLKKNPHLVTDSSESSMTAEQTSEALESMVDNTYTKKYAYEVTSDAGKWIFDIARKAKDSTVIENANSYSAIVLVKPAYRDESLTKNVRHILFTPDSYGGEEKALQMANEVYDKWKKGAKDEKFFGELASQFTDDTGSKSVGGLYSNVKEGEMVPEFNYWIFDSKRKAGDNTIVKTQYGYHIMYFVSDGDPVWKLSVDTLLRKTSYEKSYNELTEKYPVTFDTDLLYTIEESDVPEVSDISYQQESGSQSNQTSAGASQSGQTSKTDNSKSAAQQSGSAQSSAAQSSAAQSSAAQSGSAASGQ